MKVYQSILLLFSCQFIPTLGALECDVVHGDLTQIDAGSGSVVGVNGKSEVFFLQGSVFTKMNASLKHVSVGPAGWFGVDAANKIFRFQGGSFVHLPGFLKQVDAGGDNFIAGVSRHENVFCINTDASNITWNQIPGKLKYYSCGPYSCWGVTSDNLIHVRMDVSGNNCSGSRNFVTIPGYLSMIEVATDGRVFGLTHEGYLFQRTGVSQSNPIGLRWVEIVACPKRHKYVSSDRGMLWVICTDGSIRRCPL